MKDIKPHIGKNIIRTRNLLGIKQEVIATYLGKTQSEISIIEKSQEIDFDLMQQIALAMNVTTDTIRAFDENFAFIHT